MSPSPHEGVRLYVPWLTILKILSAVVLIWIWLQVWPIVLVVLVALVLAVTLEPVVRWLERRKLKRGLAVLLVGAVTLATLIIERIWLRESLGKNVLAEHARLANEGE